MKHFLLIAALLALSCQAEARSKTAPAAPKDASVPALRVIANCPPPKAGLCAMNNAAEETSWRVLTPGIEIEQTPTGWLVDFSKVWKAGMQKTTLRVISGSGVVREITVSFK